MDILKKNFKNKFIILTLCFTLIFSSLNYKKSYADGGVISAPILATVVASALGTGIVLKNHEEIYNIGRLFYDYVKNSNDLIWDTVVSAFNSSVVFNEFTKQVIIGKEFGGILKGFFDSTFKTVDDKVGSGKVVNVGNKNGYPDLTGQYSSWADITFDELKQIPGVNIESISNGSKVSFANLYTIEKISPNSFKLYNNQGQLIQHYTFPSGAVYYTFCIYYFEGNYYSRMTLKYKSNRTDGGLISSNSLKLLTLGTDVTLNYNTGTYNPGNVWGDNDINDVPIYVPGNLGDILNGNPSDVVGDKAPGWVGNGNISLPTVDNPSIGVVDGSFPQTDTDVGNPPSDIPGVENPPSDIPGEGIWATIRDFIINLVVPSDTFWIDTWNGLYNNFVACFPGVDMSNFNSLVTGEKKFPNIDIDIFGSKGRIVNGDVVNSIVNWLRPIIAGFIMLCLMFFNYRKIYKLIRNSEPFGGISPGTSDFNARMSEYQGGR